jgi:hypothetical protein
MLLRDVEGDFDLRVRVGGGFQPADLAGGKGGRRAGLLLTDGKNSLRLERFVRRDDEPINDSAFLCISAPLEYGDVEWYLDGPPPTKPVFLRLVRRPDVLSLSFGLDGKTWDALGQVETRGGKVILSALVGPSGLWPRKALRLTLPRKLKVGVVAEVTAPGTFEAVFDRFHLTPLIGKTR